MQDKKVLIVGLGISGLATAKALIARKIKIAVYDGKEEKEIGDESLEFLRKAKVSCYFNREPEDLSSFDLLVTSPGVPLAIPLLKRAKKMGIDIIGEVELAFKLGKGKYIGITGTNGKTTTTALTGAIFKQAGYKTEIVGNIGDPVIEKALVSDEETWMITELSSFQLETIKDFHPKISALLNLTPDHIDRHGSFENYQKSKENIYKNQNKEDCFIYNFDDEKVRGISEKVGARALGFSRKTKLNLGAYSDGKEIFVIDEKGKTHKIIKNENVKIKGLHNLENALAATAISFFAGVELEHIRLALESFQGVVHRQEFVAEINGISFINDSKGTNPDSSIKALEAIETPIVLIAGGYDKSASFEEFVNAFDGKVKGLVLLGATARKIKEQAEKIEQIEIYIEDNMADAVKRAYSISEKGDTVLMSPACASWGMYENYEERGDDFKLNVEKLKKL